MTSVCAYQGPYDSESPCDSLSSLTNHDFLTIILFSQRSGKGCLPFHLGLSQDQFNTLVDFHFKELKSSIAEAPGVNENAEIRQELLDLRRDEWLDIVKLLISHSRFKDHSETWIAHIIAAACMGGDHLWRDLGLPTRQSLRALFDLNFPELASKNTGDMRWKKFLYRQLCEEGGHFVCRSPTCETCPTYDECFGDEE